VEPKEHLKKLIRVARGLEKADLVLKGGMVVDVFGGKWIKNDIAIVNGIIAGVGSYSGVEEIDVCGKYITPGLIDTHVHPESSKLSPQRYAELVLSHGTTVIIADPHEIANVMGIAGVEYMAEEFAKTQLDARIMLPSCVPATTFETSGATINPKEISQHIKKCYGLGEFMNYPGVLNCDDECLDKILAAWYEDKRIDGHMFGVDEKDLNGYFVAGMRTNHECTTVAESLANIQRGCYVQLRMGSYTQNFAEMVGAVNSKNLHRFTFCSDDKSGHDILARGHINENMRLAVGAGMEAIDAVTIATLNAAQCYGIGRMGAIAPSYIANLVVFDDVVDFRVNRVFVQGKRVEKSDKSNTKKPTSTIKIKPISAKSFKDVRKDIAINFIKGSLVTERGIVGKDSNKLAVVERHKGTGNIGLCYINGFNLKRGAIAQTIAHDSHNIVVLGANNSDMAIAVNELAHVGGGITVVQDGKVIKILALPIAGLMADIDAEELATHLKELELATQKLGMDSDFNPFVSLSFISLPVIPWLKLTDKGLFCGEKFEII